MRSPLTPEAKPLASNLSSPAQFGLIWVKVRRGAANHSPGMQDKPLIDPHQEKVIALDKETQFAPNGIVSRTILATSACRVILFGFAAGQELSEHTATRPALIQILSGQCEFTLGDHAHALKAGDYVYMPPGLKHAVKATQPFSMLLTLVKAE